MAATQDEQNKKSTLNEKVNTFFQKNRKLILFGFIAVAVILVGLIVSISVRDKLQEKALSKVDGFNRRYLEMKDSIHSENSEAVLRQLDLIVLMVEIDDFAKKNSGLPSARAYSLSGEISSNQKNWVDAEKAFLNAARAAGKSYFAPVNFFNAAVAAEEQENIDAAIAHYNMAIDFSSSFPAAARAQFSIGRLEESRNNKLAALEAYSTVLGKWPNEMLWTNLAQNRIIILSD